MESLLDLTEEELAKLGLDRPASRTKLFSHIQHLKLNSIRMSALRERVPEARTIEFEDLKLGRLFAKGCTGEVYEGQLRSHTRVIVRRLAEGANQAGFLSEVSILSFLPSHPHVVAFMGISRNADNLYSVYEYVPDGTLQDFLRDCKKPIPIHTLIDFVKDVAAGMDHLHQHGVVHCNLHLGNLLIERLRNSTIVKVSEGGLMKAWEAIGIHCPISARRMSPEAITALRFSPKSDTWCFGVVMWEIFSGGKLPYAELGDEEEQVAKSVNSGYRLQCPSGCPVEIYQLMELCWAVDLIKRPTMFDLGNKLADLHYGGPDTHSDSSGSSDSDDSETADSSAYASGDLIINHQDDAGPHDE